MAPRAGYRRDRGFKGFSHIDKRLNMKGASWVEPQGAITLFDDFLMDVLADDPYITVTQSGTPLTAAAVSGTAGDPQAGLGGWIAGKTDDVDAEIDEVAIGGLGTGAGTPWLNAGRAGNGLLVCEWGFVVPTALTARQYFVGLSDDPTEGTATNGPLNVQTGTTIVVVATDAAGFILSSLATAPTVWKFTSTLNGAAGQALQSGTTAVVDEYTVCRVEIDSAGNAHFFQSQSGAAGTKGRQDPDYKGTNPLAVTTTVNLLPYFSAAPTTTTGVEWELDYVFAAQAR